MEKIPVPEGKSILNEIQEAFSETPEKIQEEIDRSGNRWLACMITRLSVISTLLNIGMRTRQIDDIKHDGAKKMLDRLVAEVYTLQGENDPTEDIDDSVKGELLQKLENIVETL